MLGFHEGTSLVLSLGGVMGESENAPFGYDSTASMRAWPRWDLVNRVSILA